MKTLSLTFLLAALLAPMAACTTSSTEKVSTNPITGSKTVEDHTVTKNPITGETTVEESRTHVP